MRTDFRIARPAGFALPHIFFVCTSTISHDANRAVGRGSVKNEEHRNCGGNFPWARCETEPLRSRRQAAVVRGRILLLEARMAAQQLFPKYLARTKMREKGQITIPKQFREHLGSGARLTVLRMGDGLVLLPEQHRLDHLGNAISSALIDSGANLDDMLDTLPRMRELIFAHRYGKSATRKCSARAKNRPRR